MKCGRCQHENPPEARFCLECGTALALRCSGCGTRLPAAAKFCVFDPRQRREEILEAVRRLFIGESPSHPFVKEVLP